jgi:Flp pilus assembly protein TadB
VLTKDQASAVADRLIADAENKSSKRALARLALRAGKPPAGVSTARFRELVDEAERHVGTSWKLLCPVGVAIIILVALYYEHALQVTIGFIPCALLLLFALQRRLVQSYIRNAVRVDA